MQAGVTQRKGTPGDAPAIRDLALVELGRAPKLIRLRELLERYPSAVAFSPDGLGGFAFGVALSPDVIEMANLLVAEPYRNQGLATRLIDLFEGAARAEYRAVMVTNSDLWPTLAASKRSAVPLYERLGYRQIYSTPDTRILIKDLVPES